MRTRQTSERPLVDTAQGPIRGVVDGRIDTFFGIPYARPPIGELRWQPPQAPEPRQSVFDAREFGPDAMQRSLLPTSRASGLSEDCLRINIWRPRQCEGLRPVMVWIHGGSFAFGSASDTLADGTPFAEGGAVFVSIGSRVGIFGFLAHPELTRESPHHSAGNYGLLDIMAGLRWVKDHIRSFGGDPERVTVFGVSSGSASIAMLMTSPLATGLFDRVILESPGSYRPLASLDAASAAGAQLGSISTLRGASAEAVLALESRLIPAMRKLTAPRILRPILDGWVLPKQERDAFESGSFTAVPTLIGSNADEGSLLVASWPVDDVAAWERVIDENFADAAEQTRRLYPAPRDQDARRAVSEMFGDTQFSLATREIARQVMKRQPHTYRYLFTRARAGASKGPDHGGEVVYVFKTIGKDVGPVQQRDFRVSQSMHAAWLQFAESASPGVVEGIAWVPAQDGLLELGDVVQLRTGWRDEQLDFINAYLTRTPQT